MKKVNIFGKSIPVFVLAILVVGIVSAALVPYLSNIVFGTAEVDSPTTLTLYGEDNEVIPTDWTKDMTGGKSMLFSKIIYNDVDQAIRFGVALIFEGTDGEGITVTSAGPCGTYGTGQEGKCVDVDGKPAPFGECWCQDLTSVAGYLHGQCSYGTSLGAVYDDAVTVDVGGIDYYVVLFGATTDETGVDANGVAEPTAKITKLGWGTPTTCVSDPQDGTNLPANSYDTGTIKVNYAINLDPEIDYKSAIAVVAPGQTLGEVINELFPT